MSTVTLTAKECVAFVVCMLLLIVGTYVAANSDPSVTCYEAFDRSGYPIRFNTENECQAYVGNKWVAAEKLLIPGVAP